VVDYLQLLSAGGRETRATEVGAISRGLKQLAVQLGCPCLALSQLNRAPEVRTDHRPHLSDLRESGALEQDADAVVLLFRPDTYRPERPDGMADLHLAKARHGPTGHCTVAFVPQYARFDTVVGNISH
jgi:replicative DNA helicase